MITYNHIHALSQLNRFNGWTVRPYSVLEHTTIGVTVMARHGYTEDSQRGFLLHDLEEAVFGDHTRPNKRTHLNDRYKTDVAAWNSDMCQWAGVPVKILERWDVFRVDDYMLAAELHCVARVSDANHTFVPEQHRDYAKLIIDETHRGLRAIDAFEDHWARLFPRMGKLA